MRKSYGVQFLLIVVLVMGGLMFNSEPVMAQTEQITLTTYYPSPFGVYRQLRARQMAVGPTWANPAVAPFDPDGGICGVGQLCHGEFFVETAMAIGARDIVATGGLQAELMVNDAVAGDSGGIIIGATGGGGTSDYSVIEFHDNTFNTLNTWRLAYRIAAFSDPNQARDLVLFYRDGGGVWQHAMSWDSVNRFVGIGTTNPQVKLDVRGGEVRNTTTYGWNEGAHFRSERPDQTRQALINWVTNGVQNGAAGLFVNSPHLHIYSTTPAGSPLRHVVLQAQGAPGGVGNVGIGTETPQVKLEVNGKIRCQSTLATDPDTTVVTKDYVSLMPGLVIGGGWSDGNGAGGTWGTGTGVMGCDGGTPHQIAGASYGFGSYGWICVT